jgi:hypothetical protein
MMETDLTSAILTWLIWVSGSGGGIVASWIQSGVRQMFPAPDEEPDVAWKHTLYTWLHAPRYKLVGALVLSGIISAAASGAIAVITAIESGDGVTAAVHAGLAMMLGVIFNQLVYRRGLSTKAWGDE